MKLKVLTGIIFSVLSFFSSGATYDPKTGYIQQIDVTSGNNLGFRILLKGVDFECGNGSRQAYLNESDSNYQTFVSVLLAARMAKAKVRIYNAEGASQNCKITYVILLDE